MKIRVGDYVRIPGWNSYYKVTKVEKGKVYISGYGWYYEVDCLSIKRPFKNKLIALFKSLTKVSKHIYTTLRKNNYGLDNLKGDYSYELASLSAEKALHEMKKELILERVNTYISSGEKEDYCAIKKCINELETI